MSYCCQVKFSRRIPPIPSIASRPTMGISGAGRLESSEQKQYENVKGDCSATCTSSSNAPIGGGIPQRVGESYLVRCCQNPTDHWQGCRIPSGVVSLMCVWRVAQWDDHPSGTTQYCSYFLSTFKRGFQWKTKTLEPKTLMYPLTIQWLTQSRQQKQLMKLSTIDQSKWEQSQILKLDATPRTSCLVRMHHQMRLNHSTIVQKGLRYMLIRCKGTKLLRWLRGMTPSQLV